MGGAAAPYRTRCAANMRCRLQVGPYEGTPYAPVIFQWSTIYNTTRSKTFATLFRIIVDSEIIPLHMRYGRYTQGSSRCDRARTRESRERPILTEASGDPLANPRAVATLPLRRMRSFTGLAPASWMSTRCCVFRTRLGCPGTIDYHPRSRPRGARSSSELVRSGEARHGGLPYGLAELPERA